MKNKVILSLFIGLLTFSFFSCNPIEKREVLENSTNIDGVTLVATQSTQGGNEITLEMTTPGITGYWDYTLGKALTNKVTFIWPIPGTATFTYTGTLGKEFFSKTIDVQVDQLDHALDQDWYDLVSDNTSEGKTWVFAGAPGDGTNYWYMSAPYNWAELWWNAGGGDMPPIDVNGSMTFDLDGAANYIYLAEPGGTPEVGSYVLDVKNQILDVNGPNILGGGITPGYDIGNHDGVYQIISLTEDEMILYVSDNSWATGWTWHFKPEGTK
ncbi:MAG TPA: hypothetical protein DEQ09_13095 [Bacteroidales bacterium]|nr:hypothetical protein [Bacteroidales bacterium]